MDPRIIDLTPQERAAKIAWYFAQLSPGEGVTTRWVSEQTGITLTGALLMMMRLSRVIPVYQDGRVWRRTDNDC